MNGPRTRHFRRGYSLIEMAIALPTIGILTVGMCGAVALTVRAIPQEGSMITASVEVSRAMEQFERDVRCATEVSKSNATEFEFRVPDRTGDNLPETIRYWWSGRSGSPLNRQINNGSDEVVLEQIDSLSLRYQTVSRTIEKIEFRTFTSEPLILASFESWPSVTPTTNEFFVNAENWIGTTFQLSDAVPRDYSRLQFTQAEVYARRGVPVGSIRIGVYRFDANLAPRLQARFGSLTTVDPFFLPTDWDWIRTTLDNDVVATDGSRTFALVFSGTANVSPLGIRYLTSDLAPTGTHPSARWTEDEGGAWEPSSSADFHKNDMMFRIYGVYETVEVAKVPETKQHLQAVQVQLRSATNQYVNVDTMITTLNQPEAAANNAPSAN
jgi:hypothetical protein